MKKKTPLTVLDTLREAAAWNAADIRGIDDITPDMPMLKARAKVLAAGVKQARVLADAIKWFREDCEAAEQTDTGDAWTLLDRAEALLRKGAR